MVVKIISLIRTAAHFFSTRRLLLKASFELWRVTFYRNDIFLFGSGHKTYRIVLKDKLKPGMLIT